LFFLPSGKFAADKRQEILLAKKYDAYNISIIIFRLASP